MAPPAPDGAASPERVPAPLWRGWTGKLALIGLVYALAYLLVFIARPWADQGASLLSDFGEVPLEAIVATLALTVVARDPRPRASLAWVLVAMALVSNLVGNVVYGSYDQAGAQPFPSLADGFYLAFYPSMLAGLLILPTASGRRELLGWRVWSNVAIVLLGGGMALNYFILVPTLGQLPTDTLGTFISLAYPAGDLALLAALGTIVSRRPFAGDRRALGFFAVGVAAWFFADLTFAIESAGSSWIPVGLSDLFYLAGDLGFLMAAFAHLRGLHQPGAHAPSPILTIGRVGPYGMLGLGLCTLLVAALEPRGQMVLLVALAVGLTVIVVARQLIDERQRRVAEAALLAEQAAAADAAARMARRDPLTSLANRASVRETLATEIAAARLTGRPVTLAFLDLNAFKAVNDNLGHAAGDGLLVEVAARLTGSVRGGDTVARLGGDEFAVILPGTGMAQAVDVATRMMLALERPTTVGGMEVEVSAAVGLATFPDGGATDDDALMHQADTAMYRAKRGHLGPTPYAASFEDRTQGLSDLAELRRAIEGDGLRLVYQPIWERVSGRTVAVEALVRWMHPTRGLVGAADFVPLAAQTGLARALDRRVLELACKQATTWHGAGIVVRTNINISRDSLQEPGFGDHVRETLVRHGVPASTVELEVTEDGLLEDPAQATRFIEQMRNLGARLAIDDFGTGFSSLARLRDLRVHVLKIDQTFVRDAIRVPADAAIIESVISLGHRLGMEVVAEGCEDQPTLTYLTSCEIDYVQGFFVGRPMNAEQITSRLLAEQTPAQLRPSVPDLKPRARRPAVS